MVHTNRRRAVEDDAASPELRASDLRAYLARLIDQLDESSLRATLKLMIRESRGAIRRQEGLIALERLDGCDTAARIDRLRELEHVEDQLRAVYDERMAQDDFVVEAGEPARTSAICTATAPLPCSFRRLAAATPQEREVCVARIPLPRFQAEPACPPSPVRHRQGRHGDRAVR